MLEIHRHRTLINTKLSVNFEISKSQYKSYYPYSMHDVVQVSDKSKY